MNEGTDWLDEVGGQRYQWTRLGEAWLETEVRPGLPCRITLGEANGHPVLYAAIGVNGTSRFWQWATLDDAGHPLPRTQAVEQLWKVMYLARLASISKVEHKLRNA